ncbi:MAG TPA: nitrilase-related carbon-nitrogen hydrolase, partial [Kofleriaceae bacterium]|nr:nitrilase-related carbon-nitrogen hydrolase [Kofleriaceae bacterium]
MATWQLRVGAIQMRSTDDLAGNLARCSELTALAASEGAQLVVLPECFSFLGREREKLAIAEAIEGPTPTGRVLGTLREIATRHGVWIVGGGMPERVRDDDRRTY